jgi:uncharacterized protein (TIGR03545 family)
MNNLSSPALIEESSKAISEFKDRWVSRLEEKEKEIKSLTAKIDGNKSIQVSSISSVEQAQSAVTRVKALYPELEALKGELKILNNHFKSEKEQLKSKTNSFSSAIENDLEYLYGFLDFSPGNMRSLTAGFAEDYIRNRWNSYYEYGLKVWNIYQKFQSREKKESKKKKGISRATGRNIVFPAPGHPGFLINHLYASGNDSPNGELVLEMKSISNEPDKVDEPTTFDLSLNREAANLLVNGSLDLRSTSTDFFVLIFQSNGIPVEIEGLLRGNADLSGRSTAIRNGNELISTIDVKLADLVTEIPVSDSILTKMLSLLLDRQESIDLNGEVKISPDGIESVKVYSDFDKKLNDSIGSYVADLGNTASSELKNQLLEYLSPGLMGNQTLYSSLDSLGIQSLDQISSINNLEKILDNKTAELENKAGSFVNELKSNVLEKAKDVIKLPGF